MDLFLTILGHTMSIVLLIMALVAAYNAGHTQAEGDKTDERDIKEGNKLSGISMVVAGLLAGLAYFMGTVV